MINEFYCYLNNETESAMANIVGADYVSPSFVPVTMSPVVLNVWQDLVSRDVQSRQYWICQLRKVIVRHFPEMLLMFDQRTAYDLSDLQNVLFSYCRPIVAGDLKWRSSDLIWWASDYSIQRREFSVQGEYVSMSSDSGRLIETAVFNPAGLAPFVLDPASELVFSVEEGSVGGHFMWATRPRQSLEQRLATVYTNHRHSIEQIAQDTTNVFPEQERIALLRIIESPTLRNLGAGALALLIVGHCVKKRAT